MRCWNTGVTEFGQNKWTYKSGMYKPLFALYTVNICLQEQKQSSVVDKQSDICYTRALTSENKKISVAGCFERKSLFCINFAALFLAIRRFRGNLRNCRMAWKRKRMHLYVYPFFLSLLLKRCRLKLWKKDLLETGKKN